MFIITMILTFLLSPVSGAMAAETKIKLEDLAPQMLPPNHPALPSVNQPSIKLETIVVSERSSFETLSSSPIVPKQKILVNPTRPSLFQEFRQILPYNLNHTGSPAGATAVNLNGRTIEDTQVSTLGVPLALPQGSGPDLTSFPHFMWDSISISQSPNQAGFTQQAASGSIDLKPWTREMLNHPYRLHDQNSRLTFSYNRQVSTFSIGTKYQNTAAIAGSSFGLLTGPSASISHRIIENDSTRILFHTLGADVEGPTFGFPGAPSPNALKKIGRVIPVIETQFRFASDFKYESTAFADIQRLQLIDPDRPANESDTRTYQYGIENALQFREWILGASARYVRFTGAPISVKEEFPLRGSLAYTKKTDSKTTYQILGGVDSLQTAGTGAIGKLGFKQELSDRSAWFASLETQPKLASLSSRYYVNAFYNGNPDLKPEQVTFLLTGHEYNSNFKDGNVRAKHMIRAEHRDRIQLIKSDFSTNINAGSANLFSLNSDHGIRFNSNLTLSQNVLFTYSKIEYTMQDYPSLARFNDRINLKFDPNDAFTIDAYAQLTSDSVASSNQKHAGYALFDLMLSHRFQVLGESDVELSLGLENIFDRRAEMIAQYPIPGRILQTGLMTRF
jgi:hypothetical protein